MPRPVVPRQAALIRIGACGVCGTDLSDKKISGTKDLNVLGSWAFTGNDLALGVDMLYRARGKYPWFDMQTLCPFDEDGASRAVADALAMRTVKSTVVPWPELLN